MSSAEGSQQRRVKSPTDVSKRSWGDAQRLANRAAQKVDLRHVVAAVAACVQGCRQHFCRRGERELARVLAWTQKPAGTVFKKRKWSRRRGKLVLEPWMKAVDGSESHAERRARYEADHALWGLIHLIQAAHESPEARHPNAPAWHLHAGWAVKHSIESAIASSPLLVERTRFWSSPYNVKEPITRYRMQLGSIQQPDDQPCLMVWGYYPPQVRDGFEDEAYRRLRKQLRGLL